MKTIKERQQVDACFDLTFDMWQTIQKLYGSIIVPSSIPIMWFGDLVAYLNSDMRIMTLSVNPSDKEFIGSRFNGVTQMDPNDRDCFYNALNGYFRNNPYMQWFQPYEAANLSLGHSYQKDVIHLDYFTSIATDPTWGNLDRSTKDALADAYKPVFEAMFALLKPDILLMSSTRAAALDVARHMHADESSYPVLKEKMLVATVYEGSGGLVINGKNMGTPMSGLKYKSSDELQKMVTSIVASYRKKFPTIW